MTELHQMALAHHQWIEDMGWHNKTTLATLGLIATEIGEAINECRGEEPSRHFAEEVADIVLRIMDLDISMPLGIFRDDLSTSIHHESMRLEAMREDPEQTHIDYLTPLYALLGDAIRGSMSGRQAQSSLYAPLKRIVAFCFAITHDHDLMGAITQKMNKNLARGTRGRTF